jgi:hypothetical protein
MRRWGQAAKAAIFKAGKYIAAMHAMHQQAVPRSPAPPARQPMPASSGAQRALTCRDGGACQKLPRQPTCCFRVSLVNDAPVELAGADGERPLRAHPGRRRRRRRERRSQRQPRAGAPAAVGTRDSQPDCQDEQACGIQRQQRFGTGRLLVVAGGRRHTAGGWRGVAASLVRRAFRLFASRRG